MHTQETKDKISKFRKGKTYEEIYGVEKAKELKEKRSFNMSGDKNVSKNIEIKQKISKGNKNKKRTNDQKIMYSLLTKEAMKNKNSSEKISKALVGRKLSEDHIKNIRKGITNYRIVNNILNSNIGKNETQLLNEIEQKENIKIERQYHIKDLGYIVDGYDKYNNVVYEVYEKAHFKNVYKIEKDLQRQKEIEDFLKCKFIIIKD